MAKFDMLKIQTSFDSVKSFDRLSDSIIYNPRVNKNNEIEEMNHTMKGFKEFGIKNTFIRESRNQIVMEFSGKILLDDYHKLITEDTIQQCIERYNEVSPLKFDVNKAIEIHMFLNVIVHK